MVDIHGHTHNERERATQRESEERGKGGGMKQHQLMCQVKGARSLGTCTRPHTHIQIQKTHQMSKNRNETYSNSPGIQNLTCCHHRAKVFQPLQIKNRIKPSETPTESASIKTLCSSSGVLRCDNLGYTYTPTVTAGNNLAVGRAESISNHLIICMKHFDKV